MHAAHGLHLLGAEGRQGPLPLLLAELRAGDLHRLLDHLMQQPAGRGLGGAVTDLLSLAAAAHQSRVLQQAQVVRHGGRGHARDGGDVDHAFLHVAQQPENTQTARVVEQAEQLRRGAEIAAEQKLAAQQRGPTRVAVIVGQQCELHGVLPFGNPFLPFGRLRSGAVDLPFPCQYNADVKIKQALNRNFEKRTG